MPECLPPSSTNTARPPKISVLVPTRNYARFLPEAIASIQAQDQGDFEILISDDASTDDSPRIIRDFAARDPRIRVALHAANLGMVSNWNWCLEQARGEYVKYVFGDDLLAAPGALAQLAALLDRHPAAGLATSARLLLDEHSNVTGWWDDLSAGRHDGPRLISRCLRRRRNLVGEPSAVMFRRALASRGFDPAYRQIVDLEMWFHLLLRGALVYDPRPLCGFRRHSLQQTNVNNRCRVTDVEFIELLERYVDFPSVQRHLRPHGWAYRRIIFRQMHYARKAGAHGPEFSAAAGRLAGRLPAHWKCACWLWHRATRPFENLHHKLKSWSDRFTRPQDAAEKFLAALPFGPRAGAGESLAEGKRGAIVQGWRSLAGGFQHQLPRWCAGGLLLLGACCGAALLAGRPNAAPRFYATPRPNHHHVAGPPTPPRFQRSRPLDSGDGPPKLGAPEHGPP